MGGNWSKLVQTIRNGYILPEMGQEWIRSGSRLTAWVRIGSEIWPDNQKSVRNGSQNGTRLPEIKTISEMGPGYQKWIRNESKMARLPEMDQKWVHIIGNGSEMGPEYQE